MSILGWVFFGLITGWIASKIVNRQGEGCFLNIALGMVGAVVGGLLFSALGTTSFGSSTSARCSSPCVGAVIVLSSINAVAGRRGFR